MTLRIELVRFKTVDFFPSRPLESELERMSSICIATKSRNLGDALALTTLPGKLKARYPGLRVFTYPRAFNPTVFEGNPHVEGIRRLPDRIYGDDANWGAGQLIQLKERFFGLPPTEDPRPELHLSRGEESWAEKMLTSRLLPGNEGKPLCVIHPWGVTRTGVAPVEFWDAFVQEWGRKFRFWQAGIEGHGAVKGCEYYLLMPRRWSSTRRLFALMSRAEAFVGVDSGPMHVARAFAIPSLILLDHVSPAEALADRMNHPQLYEANSHADARDPRAARESVIAYLESRLASLRGGRSVVLSR